MKHIYKLSVERLSFLNPKGKASPFHLQNGFLLNRYWSGLYLVKKRKKNRNQGHGFPYSKMVFWRCFNSSWFIITIFSQKLPLKCDLVAFILAFPTPRLPKVIPLNFFLNLPPFLGVKLKDQVIKCFFFYPAQIIHWFLFTRYALPSLFNKRCLPRDGQSHLTSCKISQPPPTQYDSCLLEEVREERCHTSSHCAPWIKPATVLR